MDVDLVDIIFLDVDGVLLPFGGGQDGRAREVSSFAEGCIFPTGAMEALTSLLRETRCLELSDGIVGNPALVLSSTWRARPEFVEDILSSFRAYVGERASSGDATTARAWEGRLESFFDMTDPNFHATRHDEIYHWLKTNASEGAVCCSNANSRKYTVRSWIALDDEDLVRVEGKVSRDAAKHAVRTESSVGITMVDARKGVRMLERQIQQYRGVSS